LKFNRFSALISSGVSVPQSLELSGVESEAEFELLNLAIQSGAPLAPTARALALFQESLLEFEREVTQAEAVPKATRTLMLWLPALGIVLGELLGFGSLAAISSTAGLIGFLLAIALTYIGASITQRMLERSRAGDQVPGAKWIRLQILMSAGMPLATALLQSGFSGERDELIETAIKSGASLSALIAAQQRAELADYSAQRVATAKALAVKLLIPLGLTTLPAFLIFTVLPMLIGINNK
jgi:tight adherence protein B